MNTLEQVGIALGVILSVVAIVKAGFSLARFFVSLGESLRSLTSAVQALTERFDEHARDVTHGLADVRERVARLEGGRDA